MTKRVIDLGLGLGLQLGLGFLNNDFINIVACWMKCCCIKIRDICQQEILLFMIKLLWTMTFLMGSKA